MLLALPITESSAKVRTGWPTDEPRTYDLAIWAGGCITSAAETDPDLHFDLGPPDTWCLPRFPTSRVGAAEPALHCRILPTTGLGGGESDGET